LTDQSGVEADAGVGDVGLAYGNDRSTNHSGVEADAPAGSERRDQVKPTPQPAT
jgi:hypothetical protein